MMPPRRPSPEVVKAVRRSCAAVAERPVALAEAFYAHLFEMAPAARGMFPADLTSQMHKMTETLLGAIAALDNPDTAALETTLRRLGATHATRYGVEAAHYGYIGHALTRAVRDVAGSAYSGSVSSSWISVYQWVAHHMIAGAEAVTALDAATTVPAQRGPQADPAVGLRR